MRTAVGARSARDALRVNSGADRGAKQSAAPISSEMNTMALFIMWIWVVTQSDRKPIPLLKWWSRRSILCRVLEAS